MPARKQEHHQDKPNGRAVAGKSAGPDFEDPHRILESVIQIVEQYVTEASAEQYAQDAVDDEVPCDPFAAAAAADLPVQERVASQEHADEDQAVPADFKRVGQEAVGDEGEARHDQTESGHVLL